MLTSAIHSVQPSEIFRQSPMEHDHVREEIRNRETAEGSLFIGPTKRRCLRDAAVFDCAQALIRRAPIASETRSVIAASTSSGTLLLRNPNTSDPRVGLWISGLRAAISVLKRSWYRGTKSPVDAPKPPVLLFGEI